MPLGEFIGELFLRDGPLRTDLLDRLRLLQSLHLWPNAVGADRFSRKNQIQETEPEREEEEKGEQSIWSIWLHGRVLRAELVCLIGLLVLFALDLINYAVKRG